MKRNIAIQLKTAFLLLVFGLNTMVGFACAIGVDMGFNTSHHHNETTEVSIHVHSDGKKHAHHDQTPKHHHDNQTTSKKGDCCNDKVVKISQEDKAISQLFNIVSPVFFSALIATYNNLDVFNSSQVTASARYFVRNYHPPISDIRIAIQSFQI